MARVNSRPRRGRTVREATPAAPTVSDVALQAAATRLRSLFNQAPATGTGPDDEMKKIIAARDTVVPRYQAIFARERLNGLTADDVRSFLHFKNNQHWMALQRLGPAITADMKRLRDALRVLFDDERTIVDRLNYLVPPRGAAYVPRLSRAVLTPMLLIAYPDRYGVWNQVSEAGLRELDVWPHMDRNLPFGEKYATVNSVIVALAKATGVDLWTLDSLFWRVQQPTEPDDPDEGGGGGGGVAGPVRFGLERHLHEFLWENWPNTDLGRDWALYEENGEEVGYEYVCDVGRIDLLARHRKRSEWLVIELKRNQSSDTTVGQVLRYMGWVRRRLAKPGDKVRGLIIAHQADSSIQYALDSAPDVALNLYEVEFRLRAPEPGVDGT
jgi:hypothetical protein